MKLENKKPLIARTLGVGKGRILLNTSRLDEIKQAITKQDIRDLVSSGAIKIKEKKGRKVNVKRTTRRRAGSLRKKVKNSKRVYITLTRKLRAHLSSLKSKGKITPESFKKLRQEIRASSFKSLSHMKEKIGGKK